VYFIEKERAKIKNKKASYILGMSKMQKWIFNSLIFSGILFPSLMLLAAANNYQWTFYTSTALSGAGIAYGVVCIWKAKRFETLRRAGIGLLIAGATLLVFYLVWDLVWP
jgi:hypothetical protein